MKPARVPALFLGALLAAAPWASRGTAQEPAGARVRGVVFDSMAMRPLAGAVVQLAHAPAAGRLDRTRSATTDSLGRFAFDGVPAGTWLLGFQHVAVDSLGLRSPLQRLDVRTMAPVTTSMAVPSMRAIIAAVCRRDGLKDSLAVLMGSVRDAHSDAVRPGAFVSLRWGEILFDRGGRMQRSTPIVDTFANDEGWFAACVPGGVPMTVRASQATDVSGNVELGVPAHAVLRRDLYVGAAEAEVVGPDTAAGGRAREERIVTRGRGAARGIVRALDGAPIAGARIALTSGAGESRSNARGEFTLEGLPLGTHTLEARAIGYVPGTAIVDVVDFREEAAELVLLDVSAYLLDTVRVAAARRLDAAARDGFERRRRSGSGTFVDETVLDTIRAVSFKDLVRRIPGIRFVRGNRFDDQWREHIEFTSGQRAPCIPVIYLDGAQLIHDRTDLDVIVHPASVRRIEVYLRGIAIPAEFGSNDRCGVMAIWTGPRRPG